MLEKIKQFLEFSSKTGVYLPMAYDARNKKPSITLLAFYLALILSVGSLIAYHFLPDKLIGPVSMTLMFFGMTFIFYKMRQIDKLKLDLANKTVELEDLPNNNEKEKKNEQ